MKMHKIIVSLLLISSAFATPSFANYFHNTQYNVHSNVGSARNPTVTDIREQRVAAQLTHGSKQAVVAQNVTRSR